MGGLFMSPYRRVLIDDPKYVLRLITYIHNNPVKAGLCNNVIDWEFSSYSAILSDKNQIVNIKEVMEFYDDKNHFKLLNSNPS